MTTSDTVFCSEHICRVAKKVTSLGFLTPVPALIHTLQPALVFRDEDLSKYVVGLQLKEMDIERFVSPETLHDGLFWERGLDYTSRLQDCFRLFDTTAQAMDMARQWTWANATVYSLRMDQSGSTVFFMPKIYG